MENCHFIFFFIIPFILKGLQDDPSVPGGLPGDPEAEAIIGKPMGHLVLIENLKEKENVRDWNVKLKREKKRGVGLEVPIVH